MLMNDKIARMIADTINRDIIGTEPMTEELVRKIVTGGEFTPSHPVHQQVMALYRELTKTK